MQQLPIICPDGEATLYTGDYTGGNFRQAIVEKKPDPVTGNRIVWFPGKIEASMAAPERVFIDAEGNITFPENMQQVKFITLWYKFQVTPTGVISRDHSATPTMEANLKDTEEFILYYGPSIGCQMVNGWKRKLKKDNYRPVFSPLRQPIKYTPEQLAEPAADNYDTHNADGSPIFPEPEPEPIPEPTPPDPDSL